jgi:hypothetical protein
MLTSAGTLAKLYEMQQKNRGRPQPFPIVIGILPVRNALQGRRWIFAAQSEMEYVIKTN